MIHPTHRAIPPAGQWKKYFPFERRLLGIGQE